MNLRGLNDPLRSRLAETDARVRAADGDVRKAIETWVLVRAAYGCPAPQGMVEAMSQSGMVGSEVCRFVSQETEDARTEQ